MELNIKDISMKVLNKDMVHLYGPMEANMKDNSKIITSKVSVIMYG